MIVAFEAVFDVMDGPADGQFDVLTDGQTDQPMDGQTFLQRCMNASKTCVAYLNIVSCAH